MKRYRPFSNGSQYMDWTESNCIRCKKGYYEPPEETDKCEIEVAISRASILDGTVEESMAKRMGYLLEDGTTQAVKRYVWPCTEVDWAEWWKDKCMAKLTDKPADIVSSSEVK